MIPVLPSARQPVTSIHLPQRRAEFIILLVLALLVCYIAISKPMDGRLVAGTADNAWYMNRAYLIWRGVLDDVFVYNLAHPTLMGAINLIVNELPRAAIMVNWLAMTGVIVGTYLLGRVFFNRPVAWLAVLIISTNVALYGSARLLHPFLLMQAVLVWTVLAYWRLTRARTPAAAALLGLMLALALYTRLEGAAYAVLLPAAGAVIYRETGAALRALRLVLIGGAVFGVGLALYAWVLLSHSDAGGGAFSMLALLQTQPIFWDNLSHRWMETLQYLSATWAVWVWAVALAGVVWSGPRWRCASYLLAGLVLLHVAYLFLLSTWPSDRYANNSLAFVALLFAAGLWQGYRRWLRLRLLVPLAMVAACLPGLILLDRYAARPPVSYWEHERAQAALAVDAWLAQEGYMDTEIYTLCQSFIPFSYANFHIIYRLSVKSQSDPTLWNSPAQLLPRLRAENKLLMTCPNRVWYLDWADYFEQPESLPEQLQEIGRVDDYVFYRVVAGSGA